jgi:hypothetical protein
MNIFEKIRNFLKKLQELPDNKKKIILWMIVVIVAGTMLVFWIMGIIKSIPATEKAIRNVNIPKIDMPDIKMPDLNILQTTTPTNIK